MEASSNPELVSFMRLFLIKATSQNNSTKQGGLFASTCATNFALFVDDRVAREWKKVVQYTKKSFCHATSRNYLKEP